MNASALFQAALQTIPGVSVLLYDHNLCYTLVSALPEPPFHQAVRAGQPMQAIMSAAYVKTFQPVYTAALTGTADTVNYTHEDQVYSVHVQPLRDAQGQIIGGMVTAPITGQANERHFETLLNSILESSQAGIMAFQSVRDANGQIIDFEWLLANPAAAATIGQTPEQLIGQRLLEVIPGNRESGLFNHYVRVVETSEPFNHEQHYPYDGINEWFQIAAVKLEDGFAVTFAPITERKQAEAKLRASEERARMVSELISDFAYSFRVDADGTVVQEWNTEGAFERITGYGSEELIEMDYHQLYEGDDAERVDQDRDRVLAGEHVSSEYRILTREGKRRWIQVNRYPVWDESEQRVTRFYGVAQDITQRKESELALRASEERYRVISERMSDYAYLFHIEPDGTQVLDWVTESMARVTGYTTEEHFKLQPRLIHPDDNERVQAEIRRAIAGEFVDASEYRIIDKAKAVRWIRVLRHPIWDDAHSRVVRLYNIAQDITERKVAELALRVSEERYRVIIELISDYAFSFKVAPDKSLHLEWITEDSLKRMTGYTSAEITDNMLLYHPDDLARARADIEMVRDGGNLTAEYRIITKEGQHRWLRLYRLPQKDEQQRVVRFFGVAQDITKEKEALFELEASRERYRTISELISDYAFSAAVSPAGKLTMEWLTGAFQRITGYHESAILDENIRVIHPDDSARVHAEIRRAIRGEIVERSEYRIITIDGETRWLQVSRRPVWDAQQGRVIRLYNVAQDITQRKEAEAALKESEERFRLIAQTTNDALYDWNVQTKATWFNEGYIRRFIPDGVDVRDYVWHERIHPDDYEQVRSSQIAARDSSQNWEAEYRFRRVDGTYAVINDRRYVVLNEAGEIIRLFGAIADITARKETEAALKFSEERFRLIAQATNDGLYDFDVVNGTVWRNEWYATNFDFDQPTTSPEAWSDKVHPDDLESTLADQQAVIDSDMTHWTVEYRLRNRHGQYRVVSDRAFIVRDDEGKAIRLIGAFTDITEQRDYDQRALELRVQTERIQVLTGLVRAMSHDFRTPLTVINTSIYLLHRTNDPERQQYHLDKIQDQVVRLEKLIDGLRTMALLDDPTVFEFKPVEVNRLVSYIETQESPNCRAKGVDLDICLGANLPNVIGDDTWLLRALSNLTENAIQFTPAGKSITLRTYQQAEHVVIEVQDGGIGMTEDQQRAVFTPLYRGAEHRPSDNGYGLGLPIAHKIVSTHQGRIDLESAPDVGTTFRILLPVKTL